MGRTPWHGLGQEMQPGDSLEQWQSSAGMDWTIERATVEFTAQGQKHQMESLADGESFPARERAWMLPRRDVLYRSDTCEGLGVVSKRYKQVQPSEVMAFFAKYLEQSGFQMSAAGTLRKGGVLWATARTGHAQEVVPSDAVEQYVLLSTGCDGTCSTEVRLTNVRVVCANTLAVARDQMATVKVPHSRKFDQEKVQQQFQMMHLEDIALPFDEFMSSARALAARKLSRSMAEDYLLAIAHRVRTGFMQPVWDVKQALTDLPQDKQRKDLEKSDAYKKMMALFEGEGRGSDGLGTKGTAWGLLNAVTEYVDHQPKSPKQLPADRYFSAWMGRGKDLKKEAFALAQLL